VNCCQDTTSDTEKELSGSEPALLMTSGSSLLESSEAVPVVDSSTLSADIELTPAELPASCGHVSRSTARNRLLIQLLAGSSTTDTGDWSATETGGDGASSTSMSASQSVMQASQAISTLMQSSWVTASNELSDDLNSVNVTDLFNAGDLLAAKSEPVNSSDKSDVEDQLLMAQLEQAIMSSELSIEDLDRLLAVGSSTSSSPVTAASAGTLTANTVTNAQLMSTHHTAPVGMSCFSAFCMMFRSASFGSRGIKYAG